MSLLSYSEKFIKNRTGNSRAVFGDDDEFWERYNALNPQYQSQLQPYLYYNYKSGYKDFVRGMFGMRSNEDAVREAAAAQAWQMLGSLENDSFQNDYNSAEEQASRMKDAGLNPDLSGEVSGDPAAQQEQPITPPAIDFLTPPSSYAQDLVGLFGEASQLISSASSFGSMLVGASKLPAELNLIKAQTDLTELQKVGAEIADLSGAKDVVDKYLSGISPDTWKTYMTDGSIDGGLVKQGFDDLFLDAPDSAKKYLNAAIERSTSDPRIMEKYYNAANSVIPAVTTNSALKSVHGDAVGFTQFFIERQNKHILRWTKEAISRQAHYQSEFNRLQLISAENGAALEQFRQDNHLPEAQGKAELAQFLSSKAQAEVDEKRFQAEKEWLAELQELRRSKDPEVRDAANYLIQAYFARQSVSLISTSGNGGGNLSVGDFQLGGNGGRTRQKPIHLPWEP